MTSPKLKTKRQKGSRHAAALTRGLQLYACGLNHVRAPLAIREQYAFDTAQTEPLLHELRARGAAQALVISTCNRTEMYAFSAEPQFALALRALFLELNHTDPAAGPPPIYEYHGMEAVRHLFAVGAGLDSLILGENQIKQQMQQAWKQTQAAGSHGAELRRLIDAAHRSGKRIRTETELNVGTLDVGKAAVLRGEEALGGLGGKVCVLIGAGKIGRIAARAISERSPSRLLIVNRTLRHAQELADELKKELDGEVDCVAAGIEALPQVLPSAEFILGAAYMPEFVLDRAQYESVAPMELRPLKVCLIDAAVPRIFDPDLAGVAGVELLDIEHMSGIVEANRRRRGVAAQAAWQIIEEETEKYRSALLNAELTPAIQRLTEQFDRVFEETLAPGMPDLGMEPDAAALRRRLKQRLLHEAIMQLKLLAESR